MVFFTAVATIKTPKQFQEVIVDCHSSSVWSKLYVSSKNKMDFILESVAWQKSCENIPVFDNINSMFLIGHFDLTCCT